jgi:alpha-ribazole phosphatase
MRTAAEAVDWERLIASPLVRCAAFAQQYAEQFSVEYSCDARLMEINFGAWEGRTAEELMQSDGAALTRFWEDPLHNTPTGGEPLLQFQARVLAAWNEIAAKHDGQRTLIVTHGGVIRVLLCHLQQQPLTQLQTFDIGYGSIHPVQLDHLDNASIRAGAA